LAPHSPAIDQIDTLLWIGLAAAVILGLAAIGGLLYALGRNRGERGAEPRQVTGGAGVQLRVGGALGVFAIALLVLSIVFTDRAHEAPATGPAGLQAKGGEPLTIEATGQQWLWRYNYPNGAFSYYQLVVPVDTMVDLKLVSTDVIHNWNVPDLAGKHEAVPGKVNHVVFRAEEEGSFTGDAATLSGQGYAAMRTEVKVVSPEEYEAFIEQQKTDIETAQERVVGMIENGEVP